MQLKVSFWAGVWTRVDCTTWQRLAADTQNAQCKLLDLGSCKRHNIAWIWGWPLFIDTSSCHCLCEHSSCDEAHQVTALSGKHIVDIMCGSMHSAALTASGHLCVWGSSDLCLLTHMWLFVCAQLVRWSTSGDRTEWQAHCRHCVWFYALGSSDCLRSSVCLGQQWAAIVTICSCSSMQVITSAADISQLVSLCSGRLRLWRLLSAASVFFRFVIVVQANYVNSSDVDHLSGGSVPCAISVLWNSLPAPADMLPCNCEPSVKKHFKMFLFNIRFTPPDWLTLHRCDFFLFFCCLLLFISSCRRSYQGHVCSVRPLMKSS